MLNSSKKVFARSANLALQCRAFSSGDNFISKPFKSLRDGLSWQIPKELENLNRPPSEADIVIVGGGVMGSSAAYFLKQSEKVGADVVVIERDNTYQQASSVLSCGGIRQQFSTPENVLMSMYSSHFMKHIKDYLSVEGSDPPDLQFNHQGYLFLASKENEHILHENHVIQKNCGAKVELLTPKMLKERFPWLNVDDISLGSYGMENEGWFDPWSLLKCFKSKALELGVRYFNGDVSGFHVVDDNGNSIDPTKPSYQGRKLHSVLVSMPNSPEVVRIKASYVILTAGAWSGQVGKLLGIGTGPKEENLHAAIPVVPRKRYVYVAHCPDGPGLTCPLMIDQSGCYVRREGLGGNYLMGKSPPEEAEPSCDNLDVNYDYFDEEIWSHVAHRVPAFEKLKVKNAWAGFYDYNTLDQNAIIGPHITYKNLLMATGFSGHGIQQSPAAGKLISEYILEGGFKTIDIRKFGFERCITETPVLERCIV